MRLFVMIFAASILSGCGGNNEPSQKEMKSAYAERWGYPNFSDMKQLKIADMKKEGCAEISEAARRCTYVVSYTNNTPNFTETSVFELRGSKWYMLQQ